jgi:superfamily II RNA helicase
MRGFFTILATLTFAFSSGCQTTPQQQIDSAAKLAQKTPFTQLPALYAKLESQGKLPPEVRKSWTAAWEEQNAEYQKKLTAARQLRAKEEAKRRRMLASMSPAQRAAYEMQNQQLFLQQQQMAMQQEQFAAAQRQAAWANFSNTMQNQQMINAYNQRTQTLNQPVNVNVYHHGPSRSFIAPVQPARYGGY